METVSLLEEYRKYVVEANVEDEFKVGVREIRIILKPIFKRINRWKDLSRYRDSVVAHGWRDKNREFNLVVPNLEGYDVPKQGFEFQLLTDLIKYFIEIIRQEFGKEYDNAIGYAYSIRTPARFTKDNTKMNNEITEMTAEINKACDILGKKYNLQILTYDFGDTKKV